MTSDIPYKLLLDTSFLEPWEIAARLDMLLAYPDVSRDRMTRLVNGVCADQIRVTIESFPELRDELLQKYPDYDPRTSRVESSNLPQLRDDTRLVGAAILSLIQQTATGKSPTLPPPMTQLSIDQLVRYLWPRLNGECEASYSERMHDYERRKLRRRFPVAHLSAALQYIARERAHNGEANTYDYQDLSFVRDWVARGNAIAEHIKATPALKLMASRLIQIDWIEPEQISAPV